MIMKEAQNMSDRLDLSVVIPALNEGPNLADLLPKLCKVLAGLKIQYEILIITHHADSQTIKVAAQFGVKVIEQQERGYGGALLTGFATARGTYILTMDADLSHQPIIVRDLWSRRQGAEITVASRYVDGGNARMPIGRYLLSRTLNWFFSRGLSLSVRDMSSGFRL